MLQDLFQSGVPIAEKLIRTCAVYAFLLIGLRLAGKRELSQLNPFDLVVLLLLSNTVQNAIIGNDNSLIGGVIGATTLLVLNWLVARFLFSHQRVSHYVEGDPDLLIKDGQILHDRLKQELITVIDLESAARKQGFDSLALVDSCRLEVGGAFTFEAKHPTPEEKLRDELFVRLDQLASTQQLLLTRLDALEQATKRA